VSDELVRERRGNVLVARLNRPEARNALDPALMRGIAAAMDEAESDPEIRVVVLTGTGDRAFCAGMDLRAFASGHGDFGDAESARGFFRFPAARGRLPHLGGGRAVRHPEMTSHQQHRAQDSL
jgi:enoyl-CoA hydratase/carnithine racemase